MIYLGFCRLCVCVRVCSYRVGSLIESCDIFWACVSVSDTLLMVGVDEGLDKNWMMKNSNLDFFYFINHGLYW